MVVTGDGVTRWVEKKTHSSFDPMVVSLGWEREGLVAGVTYHNWNQQSVHATIAIDGRIGKSFLKAIFDYPFNVVGVHKIIATIPQFNEDSIRICKHFGFAREAVITDAHPSGDIYIYTMTRPQCRFLENHNG
jgi:RimJ/RimL family protein N-acetyltransferase